MAKSSFELLQEASSLPAGHTTWEYINNLDAGSIITYGCIEMELSDVQVEMDLIDSNSILINDAIVELELSDVTSDIVLSDASEMCVDTNPEQIILEVCDE